MKSVNIEKISKKNNSSNYLVDIHIHTNYSACARISLDETLNLLVGKVQAITITDHNYIHNYPKETIQAYFEKYQIKILQPAVEISTAQGDILAYGISSSPPPYTDALSVVKMIHSEGGVAIAAHLYDPLGIGDFIYELDVDAIEINGSRPSVYNELAKETAKELDLPLVGGSDSHLPMQVGKCVTKFTKPIQSIQDVIEQVKKGKCSPQFLR